MKKVLSLCLLLILVSCTGRTDPKNIGTNSDTPKINSEENKPTTEEIEIIPEESGEEIFAKSNEIEYPGEFPPRKSDKELAILHRIGEGDLPDLNAMGLYTFTFFYEGDQDADRFIIFPRYKNTRIDIYALTFDAENQKMMEKLEPMFTHRLKDQEVFVLSYKLREDEPKISVRITADEKECRWVPMKGEENFNLPEEMGHWIKE